MAYYTCISCLRAISESTLVAVDKSSPFIICCDCIDQKCPYGDCGYKYPGSHECKILNIPYNRRYTQHIHQKKQCHHSLTCTAVCDAVFCENHACNFIDQSGRRCTHELIPGDVLCPMHKSMFSKMRYAREQQVTRGIEKYFPIKRTCHPRDLGERFSGDVLCDTISPKDELASGREKSVSLRNARSDFVSRRTFIKSPEPFENCAPSFDLHI